MNNQAGIVICSLLSTVLLSCQTPKPSNETSGNQSTRPLGVADKSQYISVSLINLIATPERYHNRKVYVEGFLHLGFEDNGLYLNEKDCKYLITQNALWVEVSREQAKQFGKAQDKYVVIKGTFNSIHKGHRDSWSGSIENVLLVDTLQSFR
jgi:hypothetical protein